MSVTALLSTLRGLGVSVWAEGDALRYRSPSGRLTPELLSAMKIHKEAILDFLQQASQGSQSLPIPRIPRDRPLPLSLGQQRLWFLYQFEGQTPTYNIPAALRLQGSLNVSALEAAVNEIVRRHEVLRTTITTLDDMTMQTIAEHQQFSTPLLDLQNLAAPLREQAARTLASEEAALPFDLSVGPLLRVRLLCLAPDDHILLVTFHHIVADGWSIGIFLRELAVLYTAYKDKAPSPLPELTVQYADFAYAQREWLDTRACAESIAYWSQHLLGAPPLLELPTDRPRPPEQGYRGDTEYFHLSLELVHGLQSLCRRYDTSLFMMLFSAFAGFMARYSGQEDIVIGCPIANRTQSEIEPLIGFFTNTLVLRADLSGDPRFDVVLAQIRQRALDAYQHQSVPFEKLVEALQVERNPGYTPLVQVMFILHDRDMGRFTLPDIDICPFEIDVFTAKCDLTLSMQESALGLTGSFIYNTDLYERATILRAIEHFQLLVEGLVANPTLRLSQLPFLPEAEQRQIQVVWNDTTFPYPETITLFEAFAAQADRTPDAVAVVDETQVVTYRALASRAVTLANYLVSLGTKSGDCVALYLDRSVDLIVAMLAALRTGAAYVPLDLKHPRERLIVQLRDAQPRLLLTQESFAADLSEHVSTIVKLDTDWSTIRTTPFHLSEQTGSPTDLAYVLYTSGSTGTPEGVMIEHRSVLNLVTALQHTIYEGCGEGLNVALMASAVFDASVQQIFASLLLGHHLHIVPTETKLDGQRLGEFLSDHAIELTDCTPSLLTIMLEGNVPSLPRLALKRIICGGEALSTSLVEQVYSQDTARRLRIANIYGPTECCVDVTVMMIARDVCLAQAIIPIGKPLTNIQSYLFDRYGNLAPIGVPGEICLGGVGVGRGYLNNPGKTAAKYVPHPFKSGERLYRTGDIGCWTGAGVIEFIGRSDDQVKVRGHRIEMGEIEARLTEHPAIRNAVVLSQQTSLGQTELIAYIVSSQDLTVPELRGFLSRSLPEYMIPAHFLRLDAFPLSSSGKVNRKALPEPQANLLAAQGDYEEPRDEREQLLAAIWSSILRVERIGSTDGYFALGGDSIKALQIAARLREAGFKLEMRDLFRYPTIRELAPYLVQITASARTNQPVSGEVPLTAIQSAFLYGFPGAKNRYYQTILLEAVEPLDEESLRASLVALQNHHDALRMCYQLESDGRWTQKNAGVDYPLSFRVLDWRDAAPSAAALTTHAEGVQNGVDLACGPMLHAVLYRLPQGDRLLLAAHHLVVDGVSWRFLLEDLRSAYQQAWANGTIRLPLKTDSFQTWARHIHSYAQHEVLAEAPYWQHLTTIDWPRLPYDHRGEPSCYGNRPQQNFQLAEEETSELLGGANRTYQTEPNDLLLTALAHALARWHGHQTSVVLLEGHGREALFDEVDISRTVGWFTSYYPVVLPFSCEEGLGKQIKLIKETLRAIPHKGIGYGILEQLTPSSLVKIDFPLLPEVSFNYLGRFDEEDDGDIFRFASETVGQGIDPAARPIHDLEVTGVVLHGRLQISIAYNSGRFYAETITRFACDFETGLRAIIEHTREHDAELTPSDIDYDGFDIEQLDQFLERLQ